MNTHAAFHNVSVNLEIENHDACSNVSEIGSPLSKLKVDEDVSVIDGVAMVAHLHATLRGLKIDSAKRAMEYRCDFDDPSVLVGPYDRNDHGVSLGYAHGSIEDGMLVARATCRHDNPNVFNPQIIFAGLEIPAKDYDKVAFRIKREAFPNADPDAPRDETARLFFSTSLSQCFSEDKCIHIDLNSYADDLNQWFVVEVELGEHPCWQDTILNIRLDPTNNNGTYYLDYIVFFKSDRIDNSAWYDVYYDYAVTHSLITRESFQQSDFSRSITRFEFFDLISKAMTEDNYKPVINSVEGIPDVPWDAKNADAYRMLYKVGVTLGVDDLGSFQGSAGIQGSEAIAVIDRVKNPSARLKGNVSGDWSDQATMYDLVFQDAACLDKLDIMGEYIIENGLLVSRSSTDDTNACCNLNLDWKPLCIQAERFFKLRVRVKVMPTDDEESANFSFYFITEGDTAFTEEKVFHVNCCEQGYTDPAGWKVVDIRLCESAAWRGTVTGMRLMLISKGVTCALDYVRLIPRAPLFQASHDELMSLGYQCHGMLQDNGFENGFVICHYEHKPIDRNARVWNDYAKAPQKPLWDIMSLWTLNDLWDNRDDSVDCYTLADRLGINRVVYNPEERSLSLRLNATKVYNGKAHDANFNWWPHLLLNQHYHTYPVDKLKTSAASERIFVELDMRVSDYKTTTNPNGQNSCAFLLFFYFVTDKAPNQKIWYGLTLFNDVQIHTSRIPAWSPDSAAHQYIFALTQDIVYDGLANSFLPSRDKPVVGDEWKHIRVDITEYIDQCLEWANRDKAFGYGLQLTKEDMYFGGCNIGFEIHGNYDCTVEFKNLDMIAYDK